MINFTDNKPTRPGAYWYKEGHHVSDVRHIIEVYISGGRLFAWKDGKGYVDHVWQAWEGQWSDRLVPAGEVRKAWFEGARAGAMYEAGINSGEIKASLEGMHAESHARRVAEGEE